MITPLGWLYRNPTYKEQIENIKNKDLDTFAFLGYPVLTRQIVVILLSDVSLPEFYCRARSMGKPVLLSEADMEVVLEKFKSYGQRD